MEQLPKLWGLVAPFAYAGATYAFFDVLERLASADAKAAISAWIKSVPVDRDHVAAAVQELFDRVYGYPFLSWRTVGRVAAFSIVLQAALAYELDTDMVDLAYRYPVVGWMWTLQAAFNIVCDYVSIFAIRLWLTVAATRPVIALFGGLLVGLLIIRIMYVFLGIAYLTDFGANIDTHGNKELHDILTFHMPSLAISLAAFAIHLWLPLFAASLVVAKVMNWIAKGWKDRPIRSLGSIAAVIVLAGAGVWHWRGGSG